MTGREKLVLVKNALANILRGSAAALVALILPPFLTRLMSTEAYGAWSLVLQISAYVGYLDFGIQTAVGRFVAHSSETGNHGHRDRIVSTSLVALTLAGFIGVAGVLGTASVLPRIFHQMPRMLVRDARLALILVGISLAIGLPASTFNGIFLGLQRYEIPAFTIGLSRVLSAVLLVFVAKHNGGLARMGLVVAGTNVAASGLQFLMYRKIVRNFSLSLRLASIKIFRELFNYCLSLTIWSFAMLLVTGLDLMMVGYFQFWAVGSYAVAATLITFLVGLQQAVFNVMIPSTAVQHARGDSKGLGRVVVTATRYGSFLLLLTGLPLVVWARDILAIWVGADYAVHGASVLRMLVSANMIRLSALPYVVALIGTGQQRLVTVTPLIEGSTNLLISLVAGYLYGAIGVALGTLIGSVVGVAGNFFYNMQQTADIEFGIRDYTINGLLRPLICIFPIISCNVLLRWYVPVAATRWLAWIPGVFLSLIFTWQWGLSSSERERLRWRSLVPQA